MLSFTLDCFLLPEGVVEGFPSGVAVLARWVVRQERLDRTNTPTRPEARNKALLTTTALLSQLIWIFIKHKLFVS